MNDFETSLLGLSVISARLLLALKDEVDKLKMR